MRRSRLLTVVALALFALTLGLSSCGGDNGGDDEGTTTTSPPPSAGFGPPSEGAAPPSASTLPPQLLECFADRGFEIESPAELHSAPPQVVQECFQALHQGGGVP
jgi:hypothetical protein